MNEVSIAACYHLGDIELTRPLEPLELAAAAAGFALLLRRRGCPIGFLMRESLGTVTVPVEELSSWIAAEVKTKIIEEALREELQVPGAPDPFPTLSVAICTRNRPATLRRCLDSLFPLQEQYGFELLVIDNAPSDNATADFVKSSERVRYIVEERPGLDFARNRAMTEATGQLLAYLDDDVVVDAGWRAGL